MDSGWFKKRRYLHFDRPISLKTANRIVCCSETVSKHSFYPFLTYQISSSKIYKDEEQTIQVKPKTRPIAFASNVDSHIYAYYASKLSELYEKKLTALGLTDNVLAFRKLGKNNIDFAYQAFSDIKQLGSCTAIAFDISGFFDNLDHRILKDIWQALLNESKLPNDHYSVFKSITRFSKVDREKVFKKLSISSHNPKVHNSRLCEPLLFRTEIRDSGLIERNKSNKGIPQGSPISALLSNMYMLNFDTAVKKSVDEKGGIYYRYCDDMLFIVPSKWGKDIGGIVREEIKKLNIDINPSKTEIREFSYSKGVLSTIKPLQYLGFLFDGENIFLRSASLARYSERMRRGVSLAKQTQRKYNKIRRDKGQPTQTLYKKKLYEDYSHLGKRNFIRYGLRAAEKMQSKTIKRQLKPLWKRLNHQIGS